MEIKNDYEGLKLKYENSLTKEKEKLEELKKEYAICLAEYNVLDNIKNHDNNVSKLFSDCKNQQEQQFKDIENCENQIKLYEKLIIRINDFSKN